eukprot:GFKZ01008629.1.p1 GENE.GFKZ01008629.1~~GFKZ01008629.1.p1  ORF type:complete len:387 (-),score=48.28 GFKZ01008629.1:424-1584(-)
MAVNLSAFTPRPSPRLSKSISRFRHLFRRFHPAYITSVVLFLYIIYLRTHLPTTSFEQDFGNGESHDAIAAASLLQADSLLRSRLANAANASNVGAESHLGNHFCILQPTLSAGKTKWTKDDARQHIALRAFLRTFATTVTDGERRDFRFSIYYGHDSDDAVLGNADLREEFESEAWRILGNAGFKPDGIKLVFSPLYGLHSRINAIWNVLAKDAYYDGCDYFFLSNDDMVFFTNAWVSRSRDSLAGIGSPKGHKRPCRYFGIVRFKDEWADWATFTFHVSTRMHLEIFGGVYYPVPYNSAHNDYWINFVYHSFQASKYRGEIKVRNRVEDVDYALAHPKDTSKIAPPRYTYDKRGDARKYIEEGRARVRAWLEKYKHTDRCLPPL